MITSQQMKELEEFSEAQGITSLELMENAGREFAVVIRETCEGEEWKVIIFAGCGNNGGDSFVAARYLSEHFPVTVLLFGEKKKMPAEAKKNFLLLDKPITIFEIRTNGELEKFHIQKDSHLIMIDALLGTGIKGNIREPLASAINLFNNTPGVKFAVDIPSGLNPDTGELAEKHCQVDHIITFHDLKIGLSKWKNITTIVDIGIPIEKQC